MHTPALQTGTHFLLTLETIVFLFHLLGATSKLFSSLSTRLAHAARLGFFLQKRAIFTVITVITLAECLSVCLSNSFFSIDVDLRPSVILKDSSRTNFKFSSSPLWVNSLSLSL